jgi:hypothetical protein
MRKIDKIYENIFDNYYIDLSEYLNHYLHKIYIKPNHLTLLSLITGIFSAYLIYTNHFFPENFKINEIVDSLDKKGYRIKVITCIPNYPSGKIYPGYGYLKKTKEKKGNVTIRRLPLISREHFFKCNLKEKKLLKNFFSNLNFFKTWS